MSEIPVKLVMSENTENFPLPVLKVVPDFQVMLKLPEKQDLPEFLTNLVFLVIFMVLAPSLLPV